jgi:hypothetical protein
MTNSEAKTGSDARSTPAAADNVQEARTERRKPKLVKPVPGPRSEFVEFYAVETPP